MTKDEMIDIHRLELKIDDVSSRMVTMELLAPFFQSRDEQVKVQVKRLDDALASHIVYSKELADAEKNRIDSNREVDGKAVLIATDRASDAAGVLAKNVTDAAEAMRKTASEIAATLAAQLQQFTTQFMERLLAIEKWQSKNEGRSGLSAPLLMMIAGLAGGLIVYFVQTLIR